MSEIIEAYTDTEEWRPIADHPRYEVSNRGRIRSHVRRSPRILQPWLVKGYPMVGFQRIGGRRPCQLVHVLVAEAFIGPRPEGLQVRHLDGNRLNSDVANLAYGTPTENSEDTIAHGHHPGYEQTHCKSGHELSAANVRLVGGRRSRQYRVCRECERIKVRKWQAKHPDRVKANRRARTLRDRAIREATKA